MNCGIIHTMNDAEQQHRKILIARTQSLGQTVSTEAALFCNTAACSYNLGVTDMKLVSSLLQDGPMTAGQIAARLGLTSGAVTNVIDRLEQRGIVHRTIGQEDKRKVIVAADKNYFKGQKNVYLSIGKAFESLLQTYSTAELEFLSRHLEATINITKQEIKKLQVRCQQ